MTITGEDKPAEKWLFQFNIKALSTTIRTIDLLSQRRIVGTTRAHSALRSNIERRENVQLALDKFDGVVRAVIAIVEDEDADLSKIANVRAISNVLIRITEFDRKTNKFRAYSM